MLRLDISGDSHPKTVKLVTDDSDAELHAIMDWLNDAEVAEGDPFREWFDKASAEELAAGVEIPQDHVGEWFEILEEFPGVMEQTDALRREAAEATTAG